MLAVIGLTQFLTQVLLLRPMLRRYSEAWMVVIGNLLRTAGLIGFALVSVPVVGTLAGVMLAMGMGIMMPPLQAISTRTVEDELRGGVLGLYQSAMSLAIIFSTASCGRALRAQPHFALLVGGGPGAGGAGAGRCSCCAN